MIAFISHDGEILDEEVRRKGKAECCVRVGIVLGNEWSGASRRRKLT
jgi:hypothetical protein